MPPHPHRLPADIRYGVDDIPPPLTTWVQALQHLALVAINFIFVLLVVVMRLVAPQIRRFARHQKILIDTQAQFVRTQRVAA